MAKKDYKEILLDYTPGKPSLRTSIIFYFIGMFHCKKMKPKYIYNFDRKKYYNKQVLFLCDHGSRDNFYYFGNSYPLKRKPNMVVGFQNFYRPVVFNLLKSYGAIPKSLFSTDIRAVKRIINVSKDGGNIALFPEGTRSYSGSSLPIAPGTYSLIKKLGLPVIVFKSKGAYLSRSKFNDDIKKGPMEYEYKMLFDEEQVKSLSKDEIRDKILKELEYNDFEWNQKYGHKYIGKTPNATGLDHLLYHCPKCNSDFQLEIDNEDIVCKHCGNRIHVDESYELIPINDSIMPYKNIDDWFKNQRSLIKEYIKNNKINIKYDAEYFDISYKKLKKDTFYKRGEGIITITKDGIRYEGTKDNENVDLFFDLKYFASFLFLNNRENFLYYQNDFYSFRPKDTKDKTMFYCMLIEELHNLIDSSWNEAFDFTYNKTK